MLLSRNYIFAPSVNNRYGSSSFPSIVDSLLQVNLSSSKGTEAVEKELTLVALVIESGANWIENGVNLIQ